MLIWLSLRQPPKDNTRRKVKMRHIPLALFSSALIMGLCSMSAVSTAAQPAPATCPKLDIFPGEGATSEGAREIFSATVVGGAPTIKPEFKWTATAGKGELASTPGVAWL